MVSNSYKVKDNTAYTDKYGGTICPRCQSSIQENHYNVFHGDIVCDRCYAVLIEGEKAGKWKVVDGQLLIKGRDY